MQILGFEFQTFFSITRTIFSHRRSEIFQKQNTYVPFLSFSIFFQVDNESQLQALDDYYYYEEDNSRYSNRKGPIYDYYDYDMDDRIHDIRKNNAIFRYTILRNNFYKGLVEYTSPDTVAERLT